ncbi:MAG: hypothetical protein ACK4RK_20800 [Gemmataceae bacterium]
MIRYPLLATMLAATVVVVVVPAPASAASLGFRNESTIPVYVQGEITVNGIPQRSRPYLLQPGQFIAEATVPGTKIITVYDARQPARVLFRGPVVCGLTDVFFSIQVQVQRVGNMTIPQALLIPVPTLIPVTRAR